MAAQAPWRRAGRLARRRSSFFTSLVFAATMHSSAQKQNGLDEARFVPAGCIIVSPTNAQTLLNLVKAPWNRSRSPRKSQGNKRQFIPYNGPSRVKSQHPLLACTLNPEAVWDLSQDDAKDRIPEELWKMLETNEAEFIPGLRLGSPECGGTSAVLGNLPEKSPEARFHFIELFAGIGGFRVALNSLGGQCLMASEIDPQAQETYSANFGDIPCGDITEIIESDIPSHDILTAGFPCQAFSIAGKQGGFMERNGNLFFEVTRVLRGTKPKAFLLENVPGLMVLQNGTALQIILDELRKSGYRCTYCQLRANPILPQKRRRLFIVGIRKDLCNEHKSHSRGDLEFNWPETLRLSGEGGENYESSLFPKLEDILESDVGEEYNVPDRLWERIVSKEQEAGNDAAEARVARHDEQARTVISSYRRSPEWLSQFVWRNKVISNDSKPRFFTEREVARMQGFPESFDIDSCSEPKRLYHQLGNAVSPPIVREIAARLLKKLGL